MSRNSSLLPELFLRSFKGTMNMRSTALLIVAVAAIGASAETAEAARNCGPGMNSDGYRGCVPIARGYGYRRSYGYYAPRGYAPRYYGRGPYGPRDCGPGMNSDGYRGCVPITGRYYRY